MAKTKQKAITVPADSVVTGDEYDEKAEQFKPVTRKKAIAFRDKLDGLNFTPISFKVLWGWIVDRNPLFSLLASVDPQTTEPRKTMYDDGKRYAAQELNYNDTDFTVDQLEQLRVLMKPYNDKAARETKRALDVAVRLRSLTDPLVPDLKTFERMLEQWLRSNCTNRGWLYMDGEAVLPTDVSYDPGHRTEDWPKVILKYTFNKFDNDNSTYKQTTETRIFYGPDVLHQPVGRLLAMRGIFAETDDHHAEYDVNFKRWRQIWDAEPLAYKISKGTLATGKYDRGIEVTRDAPRVLVTACITYAKNRRSEYASSSVLNRGRMPVPCRFQVRMYDLASHQFVITTTPGLVEKTYNPELDKDLVLPALHSKLVTAIYHAYGSLASQFTKPQTLDEGDEEEQDYSMFTDGEESEDGSEVTAQSDLVAGKNAGNIVLSLGPAGAPKGLHLGVLANLTAHGYFEKSNRSFYRLTDKGMREAKRLHRLQDFQALIWIDDKYAETRLDVGFLGKDITLRIGDKLVVLTPETANLLTKAIGTGVMVDVSAPDWTDTIGKPFGRSVADPPVVL